MISDLAGSTLDVLPRVPFRRADAVNAGVSSTGLRELLRVGLLRQPLRGVLVPADLPDSVELRASAARLVLPGEAALCRGTAGWLLGVDARPPGDHLRPPPLECCVPAERSLVRRLDLGYLERRHAWEYDGEEFHLGREAEAADRLRRDEIERRWGWTVVGVGKNLVLGPSLALEYAVGEVLGLQPRLRRRLW